MKNNLVTLKQLDRQLARLKEQGGMVVPKQGWVRTLRKALGFTIKQMANRLKVDPSRVVKIEISEIDGAVTLRTMQTVAETLDSQFVYAFIPKTNLEDMIKKRAKAKAFLQVKRTSHTMDLEAQSIDKQWFEEQVNELAEELVKHSWRHLWEE